MKSLNSHKPDQAKEAIISAAVVIVLVTVAIFLFRLEDRTSVLTKQEVLPSVTGRQDLNSYAVSPDAPGELLPDKPVSTEPLAAREKKHAIVSKLPKGISPPLPLHDVPVTTKQVNANIGELFTTRRKSQIMVPQHAFLDESGKVVQGKVDIQYREFHDFRDIFLSGIPMNYDKNTGEMLESAGMIELTASKDNKPVYVNPESRIRVMLASAIKSTDYNLYFYDKKERKWKQKGKDEVVLKGTSDIRMVTDPCRKMRPLRFMYDKVDYKVGIQCISNMAAQRKYFFSKKKAPTRFEFMLISCPDIHPETKILRGIRWRYEGEDAPDIFSKIFNITSDFKWSAFRTTSFKGQATVKLDKDRIYHFEMIKDSLVLNIPIAPIIESDLQAKGFNRKWTKYLAATGKNYNDEEAAFAQFQKDTAGYYARFGRENNIPVTAQTSVLRSFQIDGFGIWNCDRPYMPESPNSVYARFVDEKGSPLFFNTAYMVEKTRNSVYTVADFQHFRFNPEEEILCWAILPGDMIAIIYPAEFVRHSEEKKGRCTFVAKVNENAIQSYASLHSALSFNKR